MSAVRITEPTQIASDGGPAGEPVAVYTPDPALRHPFRFAANMWRDVAASRELAWRLMVRDISARYRQSVLGFVWAFLPPIATALVFIFLNREQVINAGETAIPYPAYVMIGTVLWQTFIDALNAPLRLVVQNRSMLAKINFPREALILSGVGQVMFDFLIKLVIVAAVFVMFQLPLTWGIPLAIFPIIALILLGTLVGLFLTPLGVLYTDIASGLAIFTSLWFFVTPVAYNPPDRWPFSLLVDVNPVSPALVAARDLLTAGAMSNMRPFLIVTALTLAGMLVVWVVYRLSIPILIEKMSAS
jgi:lipopolysaccharide transport system permease protein